MPTPHAYVRFCMYGMKKPVPITWFKSKFDYHNYDSTKAYLVFYSPGDAATPESMLKSLSKIPCFETAECLDKYEGLHASGYYRASVCFVADSMSELQELMISKRSKAVPVQYLKETSFEVNERIRKDSSKTTKVPLKKTGHSSKKGKINAGAAAKRQSLRSNVNALKQKLIKLDDSSSKGVKNNGASEGHVSARQSTGPGVSGKEQPELGGSQKKVSIKEKAHSLNKSDTSEAKNNFSSGSGSNFGGNSASGGHVAAHQSKVPDGANKQSGLLEDRNNFSSGSGSNFGGNGAPGGHVAHQSKRPDGGKELSEFGGSQRKVLMKERTHSLNKRDTSEDKNNFSSGSGLNFGGNGASGGHVAAHQSKRPDGGKEQSEFGGSQRKVLMKERAHSLNKRDTSEDKNNFSSGSGSNFGGDGAPGGHVAVNQSKRPDGGKEQSEFGGLQKKVLIEERAHSLNKRDTSEDKNNFLSGFGSNFEDNGASAGHIGAQLSKGPGVDKEQSDQAKALRKRKREAHFLKHDSSNEDEEEEEDCFVPIESHKKALMEINKKDLELKRLRQTIEKLRDKSDPFVSINSYSESQDLNLQSEEGTKDSESSEEEVLSAHDELAANVLPPHIVSDDHLIQNSDNPEREKLMKLKRVFEKFKRNIDEDKLKELVRIPVGVKSDKPFVKTASVLMWGSDYLMAHSTNGRRNPKDPTAAIRPALDEERLKGVQELLILRVRWELGLDTLEVSGPRCSVTTIKRFIGEKIQSLITSACRKSFVKNA